MKKRLGRTRDYFLIVSCFLLISLFINLFTGLDNYKYKDRAGKESYKNIEDIRNKNNNNFEILDSAVNNNEIKNIDLFTLYKNYTDISSYIISLWDDYSFYQNNKTFIIKRKAIDTQNAQLNDNNNKIQAYLKSLLDLQMKNNSEKLVFTTQNMYIFIDLRDMSKDIEDFYVDFNNEKLSDVAHEDKTKKIIKNNYWIDMLDGLNKINDKYADVKFSLE